MVTRCFAYIFIACQSPQEDAHVITMESLDTHQETANTDILKLIHEE